MSNHSLLQLNLIRREIDIITIFRVIMGKQNFTFRLWFYFRQGWGTYFAFIFSAINTLTVTYYLAIEEYPLLVALFPNFGIYVFAVSGIGIPILILAGYFHFKKSQAFQSEADINIEVNAYHARIIVNSELNLKINTLILDLIQKSSLSNSLSDNEKQEIENFRIDLDKLTKDRSVINKNDSLYFKKLEQEKLSKK
jgi:hypothetical protein